MNEITKNTKRTISLVLSAVMIAMLVFQHWWIMEVRAAERKFNPGDTVVSGIDANWGHYCIDGYGILGESGGILGDGELYMYVLPSEQLSKRDRNILFWATMSMLGSKGANQDLATIYNNMNEQALGAGLPALKPAVSEKDLKEIIHRSSVLKKYPWIDSTIANAETYMKLGGIIGSSQNKTTNSGKSVPAVIQDHNSLSNALNIESGILSMDKDFIDKVPLEFSLDGSESSWSSLLPGGWVCQKTDTAIMFSNTNPQPPKLFVRFNTKNTEYAGGGGMFSSVEEAYERGLQLWVCIACNNAHVTRDKTMPVEAHQRLVYMEMEYASQLYYAALAGGSEVSSENGGLEFNIYRHEEDMTSTVNLQLNKYDYETGKALEDAIFKLYERFDDKDQINTKKDGPVQIYEGGEPYKSYHTDNPTVWDDFRYVASVSTDEDGYASKTVNHGYHYDKTFCDGHPAPRFIRVPDEEYDEEGDLENGAEIAAAQAENRHWAKMWLDCVTSCEDKARGEFEGVHFHWRMSSVRESEIKSIASSGGNPGEHPSAGTIKSASGEVSYQKSGCQNDCQDTYDKFISLKYSYTWKEDTARDGYIRHDLHADDLPIEVITTDASEHGANAYFAGQYSNQITIKSKRSAAMNLPKSQTSHAAGGALSKAVDESPDEYIPASKTITNYLQNIVPFFATVSEPEQGSEEVIVNDLLPDQIATPANARRASSSNAFWATGSNAVKTSQVIFSATSSNASANDTFLAVSQRENQLFLSAYKIALNGSSYGSNVIAGQDNHYSHCSDSDNEGDRWRIYDHRTEGEIHINKKDMELEHGETDDYHAVGDSQGDATLEGAVYGLFAAADIVHPDGKTGIVYRANHLVAIAATDKEGDASFLANTEAPGVFYNYETGEIKKTADGWNVQAPKNMYVQTKSYDDYTEDGTYQRVYSDNESDNGNCWIGRPILLGDYYIRELSRSEGYELSIGNKQHEMTNYNQNYEVTGDQGQGYVSITKNLYAEGQISEHANGDYGNPDFDELFFLAESRGTGESGFDLVLSHFPQGAKFYRLDTSCETTSVEVGTGTYEKIYLENNDGSPVYVVVEHEYQYPKYHADGTIMTKEVPVNIHTGWFPVIEPQPLDPDITKVEMESQEPSMDADQVREKLEASFAIADVHFLKGKVEKILRKHKKYTPKMEHNKTSNYSTIDTGVYDNGIREGEIDSYGISGVAPGEIASKTVYGAPVITLELPKWKEDGTPITLGDTILSVLDFYNTNDCYNYGGIHDVEEGIDEFLITVYAGRAGNPENFMIPGRSDVGDGIIYHRVSYAAGDLDQSPRYVYAAYSNNDQKDAFGTYMEFQTDLARDCYIASAVLVTDSIVDAEGRICPKMITENVYYSIGEIPCDADGNKIQAFEYREQTTLVEMERNVYRWVEIPMMVSGGKHVVSIDSSYTDFYGVQHQDNDVQQYSFRVVVPEKWVSLTQTDLEAMSDSADWKVGDFMGGAAYYLRIKSAHVKGYLNHETANVLGENSYVQPVSLQYPGDTYVWQDGERIPGTNTRLSPIAVQERMIKQQIKVEKIVDREVNTSRNWFVNFINRIFKNGNEAAGMDNFRFKIYLKSNLERLYRTEAGEVIWQDRKGNHIDILQENENYPALVSKIFTKVQHERSLLYKRSEDAVIKNESLFGYTDGFINSEANSGYTAILEKKTNAGEESYNYEKFFDAIAVANHDYWDDNNPMYTSERPIGNEAHRSEETLENAKASDWVRQFAITWYLKDEVAKLTNKLPDQSKISYSDEVYDEALCYAIEKANAYLRPFFSYDFDEIYAIAWDSEVNGGKDRDPTTLSADAIAGDYCFGISKYLPYGIYVMVEQQPQYKNLHDLKNKHYQIDKPREIILPSVYQTVDSDQGKTAELAEDYYYHPEMPMTEMEAKFQIRFGNEAHVVKAHNHSGDFEIYKYGLDIDRINNGVPEYPGLGDYFALTQAEYKPRKNYYNEQDDRTKGAVSYYLSEGQTGRADVSKYYKYSSVAEHPEMVAGVLCMKGELIAEEDRYAPMLVPYTVTAPAEAGWNDGGENPYVGYASARFQNQYYTSKLRVEKLDSETGENILHDQAIFALYIADKDEREDGEGRAKFYQEPTLIMGTKGFLEAMGAEEMYPRARGLIGTILGEKMLWYGTVPAGTPVCYEADQVMLANARAFTTMRTGEMMAEAETELVVASQNTGYLELPQPLDAGVYVLAEIKPPAGYARSKPIAVEIYSDQVSYYRNGEMGDLVAATIYQNTAQTSGQDTSRVYVANTPIRLEITKKKADETTITYRISGRVEGSITELAGRYGLENIELAYHASGTYMGYGWKRGMPEYLEHRKASGEEVTLFYEKGVFAGYGEVTYQLRSAKDENRYVAGAKMTLYDAINVKPNKDSEDNAYEGIVVERDRNSNVVNMYVKEGYAGNQIEFVQEEGIWTYQRIQRPDTDILFYDLGGLEIFSPTEEAGITTSVFARKNNQVIYEIVGSDLANVHYDIMAKAFTQIEPDTIIYHLDAKGNRDAMVHPYTGMAYAMDGENIVVWSVSVVRDKYGNVISREKQKTSRIATINADTSHEYTIGTYQGLAFRFWHWMNPVVNGEGQVIYYQKSKERYQKSKPVYDRDGDFMYDRYDDRIWAFNKNAYIVKEKTSVFDQGVLWDEGDNRNEILSMRQGESYIMENTWMSGEQTPNDPFSQTLTSGRADLLKRVIPGTYILEELEAPDGYEKALPLGITVKETTEIQRMEIEDRMIKVEIDKIDCPPTHKIRGLDYDQIWSDTGMVTRIEGKRGYTYGRVAGVTMALYPARKVYTTNREEYPDGWYLEKRQETPLEWNGYDEMGQPGRQIAQWTTDQNAHWLEGIPAGVYLLEELDTPAGYIKANTAIVIEETGEVQTIGIPNDHTKVEIYKYQTVDGRKEVLPNRNAAVLSLYETSQAEGNLVETWTTNDCRQYTARIDLSDYGSRGYSGFQYDYEEMYEQYGTGFDELRWYYTEDGNTLKTGAVFLEESHEIGTTGCVRQQWRTKTGECILITISPARSLMDEAAYTFEYQYHVKWLKDGAISYDTADGCHRIDYLPGAGGLSEGKTYLLVEEQTPAGFIPAPPKEIKIKEIADIQMYGLENKPEEPGEPPQEPEEPTEETTTETPEEPSQSEPETTVPETTKPSGSEPESSPAETTKPEVPVPSETSPRGPDQPGVSLPEETRSPQIGYISARYDAGDQWAAGIAQWLRETLARTGDEVSTILLLLAFLGSGTAVIVGVRRRKRGQEKNNQQQ